jgi:N-acetylglucosaminyldiphosphoundecaprenol N-acetyl-beta-D-mannosaminyltransferase
MDRPRTFSVLGVPVAEVNLDTAAGLIESWAKDDVGRFVTCPDVSNVMRSQDDQLLMAAHLQAAMVVPDGTPLVWVGRARGMNVSRTCGPDLFEHLMARSAASNCRHYLLGGRDGVAQQLKERMEARYPFVSIVGLRTPPFRDMTEGELSDVSNDIRESGADIVWVGISTPKQEFLMQKLVASSDATFIGVGAAFDFHAGVVQRAPKWMQKNGLEWIYRLLSEPRRLWKRYLVMAPMFVVSLIASQLGVRRK